MARLLLKTPIKNSSMPLNEKGAHKENIDEITKKNTERNLNRFKIALAAGAITAGITIGLSNTKVDANTVVPLPTINFLQIKQNNNNIKIGGRSFIKYNGNLIIQGNGSIKNPYIIKEPEINLIGNLNNGQINNNAILSQSLELFRENELNKGFLNNVLNGYKGLGYYTFNVCIGGGSIGTMQLSNEVIGLESSKPLTWIDFLTDANTLYSFRKTTENFVEDSIKRWDYKTEFFEEKNGKQIFFNLNDLEDKNTFQVINNCKFIYQLNTCPGMGDGTKEFPFDISKKNVMWRGRGYYAFEQETTYTPRGKLMNTRGLWSPESKEIIKSLEELNKYYFAVYGIPLKGFSTPESESGIRYFAKNIDGKDFILKVIFTGDIHNKKIVAGDIEQPFTGEYKFKGRYMIGGIITPIANSQGEYEEYRRIISSGLGLLPKGRVLIPINMPKTQLSYWGYKNMTKLTPQQALELIHETNHAPPSVIYNENPILQGMRRDSSTAPRKEYKFNKIINGKKFDFVHLGYNVIRNGSFERPFIAQQGPRGIGYYQIYGTDLMTAEPIDGIKIPAYLKALGKAIGTNFNFTEYNNVFGATYNTTSMNGYLVRKYYGNKTFGFGTVTQPYLLFKNRVFGFQEGVPSFFIIGDLNKTNYENLNPISNIEELDRFYFAVTGKHLSNTFRIGSKIYNLKNKNQNIKK